MSVRSQSVTRWGRAPRTIATAAVALAALASLAAVGLVRTHAQLHQQPSPKGPAPAAESFGHGKLAVAVVLGATGTIGTDAMGPYQVFADSPHFTVYTVAVHTRPVPVDGAPWIVPTYTFAQVAGGKAPSPDVVVVPALDHPDSAEEAAVREFVAVHARRGVRILSVCNGARVVAATGLLDDLRATAHWSRLPALRRQHPQVDWVEGRRYVDAQRGTTTITTTAGITSGIPAALHVVADLVGDREATRISGMVPYPGWSPQAPTRIPVREFGIGDVPVLANHLVPWGRPAVGIALRDGVEELSVAATFEVYTVSSSAHTVPLSTSGWVTTRHGMVLATTPTTAAPHLDRHLTVAPTATGDVAGNAFDRELQRLAVTSGTRAARSAAKMLDYPGRTHGRPVRWAGLRGVLIVAGAVLLVLGVPTAVSRRRRGTAAPRRRDPAGGS